MNAGLRQRHRTLVTILFVLVVVFYTWAIMARKATPRMSQPPGAPSARHGTEVVIP